MKRNLPKTWTCVGLHILLYPLVHLSAITQESQQVLYLRIAIAAKPNIRREQGLPTFHSHTVYNHSGIFFPFLPIPVNHFLSAPASHHPTATPELSRLVSVKNDIANLNRVTIAVVIVSTVIS